MDIEERIAANIPLRSKEDHDPPAAAISLGQDTRQPILQCLSHLIPINQVINGFVESWTNYDYLGIVDVEADKKVAMMVHEPIIVDVNGETVVDIELTGS